MHSKKQLRELALSARAALGKEQRAAKSAQIANHLLQWQPFLCARTLCLYASFGTEVRTDGLLAWLLSQQSRPVAVASAAAGAKTGVSTTTETAAGITPETRAADAAAAATGAEALPEIAATDGAREATEAGALTRVNTSTEAGALTGANAAVAANTTGGSQQILCLPRVEGDELVIHRISSQASGPAISSVASSSVFLSPEGSWPELVRSPMGMPEPPASLPVLEPQALELILIPGSAFCLRTGHRLGYGKGFYDRLLARAPQALKIGLCFDVQLFETEDFPSAPHDIPLDVLVSESGIRDLRGSGA